MPGLDDPGRGYLPADLGLLARLGLIVAIGIAAAIAFGSILAGLHALEDLY